MNENIWGKKFHLLYLGVAERLVASFYSYRPRGSCFLLWYSYIGGGDIFYAFLNADASDLLFL